MTPAELAYRAAQIMAEKGHCKNTLTDDEGRVCLVGALMEANVDEEAFSYKVAFASARAILLERGYTAKSKLQELVSYTEFLPIEYNNDPATTGEDVIQLLKEAGYRLDEAAAAQA